ncbi:uncharacterized protein EMH_0013000 [Eimeria mitis]|uniref:Uncharacterized protein n=1 Tax=Eimeria mitis TaxID=44415 RepID=U6K8P5_9EIME|nr:uncharacterized protein EMH_0013000 [Eimeria mitis]CDJ32587.1 hypothetical protein EMH_0013000 [Eimeria mitis]
MFILCSVYILSLDVIYKRMIFKIRPQHWACQLLVTLTLFAYCEAHYPPYGPAGLSGQQHRSTELPRIPQNDGGGFRSGDHKGDGEGYGEENETPPRWHFKVPTVPMMGGDPCQHVEDEDDEEDNETASSPTAQPSTGRGNIGRARDLPTGPEFHDEQARLRDALTRVNPLRELFLRLGTPIIMPAFVIPKQKLLEARIGVKLPEGVTGLDSHEEQAHLKEAFRGETPRKNNFIRFKTSTTQAGSVNLNHMLMAKTAVGKHPEAGPGLDFHKEQARPREIFTGGKTPHNSPTHFKTTAVRATTRRLHQTCGVLTCTKELSRDPPAGVWGTDGSADMSACQTEACSSDDWWQSSPRASPTLFPRGTCTPQGGHLRKEETSPQTAEAHQSPPCTSGMRGSPLESPIEDGVPPSFRKVFNDRYFSGESIPKIDINRALDILWNEGEIDGRQLFRGYDKLSEACCHSSIINRYKVDPKRAIELMYWKQIAMLPTQAGPRKRPAPSMIRKALLRLHRRRILYTRRRNMEHPNALCTFGKHEKPQ